MAAVELRAGAARATLLPARGAAFARLADGARELLVPVPEGADPNRGFHGAFLMAPWANRLDGGRIVAGGVEHRMAVNRPEEGTAIHGFLRELPWQVARATATQAELGCAFDRAPFRGTARLHATLEDGALRLELTLTGAAPGAVPMGFGWHPFFPRPRGTRLRLAARTAFGRDPRGLPVAPRPSAGLAGDDAVLEGLDLHLAGWDGAAEIAWPDGAALRLRAAGAWSANAQVFAPRRAPDGGGVLCVEPVSHAPDAANRAAAAAHGAMHVLAPRGMLSGSLMIHWR